MTDLRISGDRLLGDLERLARFGALPEGGLHRRAFGPEFEAAVGWLMDAMTAAGLAVRRDAAGNVIGRLGPAEGPAVLAGSHIDTVPGGGAYDGALGVLAALECARVLGAADRPLTQAFEVVAFADEEGAYGNLYGSRTMLGEVDHAELEAAVSLDGEPLVAALARIGRTLEGVPEAARRPVEIAAYLELHIEQGPVLEREGLAIGIVEGIVGILSSDVTFTGQADHAGTTPLPLRRDAFRGSADYVTRAYGAFEAEAGPDMRLTFGAVEVAPGAGNVVPARARLRQEIRGLTAAAIDALYTANADLAHEVAAAHGLEVTLERHPLDQPASMSPRLTDLIEAVCRDLDLPARRMPSGAGHDAQVMAQATEAAMIFVPSRGGASHRADEWTAPEDLVNGAEVLLQTAARLVGAQP